MHGGCARDWLDTLSRPHTERVPLGGRSGPYSRPTILPPKTSDKGAKTMEIMGCSQLGFSGNGLSAHCESSCRQEVPHSAVKLKVLELR